jgi:hypothetical protein
LIKTGKTQKKRRGEIMNIEQWQTWLIKRSACVDGYAEAKNYTPDEWYQKTERGDWMIWVLRKIPQYKNDKALWVKIAIESAKLVLHLAKDPQNRPQLAIEAAENWLIDPTDKNRCIAANAAYAANAADATYAAYAAANAVRNQVAGIVRALIPNLEIENEEVKE